MTEVTLCPHHYPHRRHEWSHDGTRWYRCPGSELLLIAEALGVVR